jgi:hypothetical protein
MPLITIETGERAVPTIFSFTAFVEKVGTQLKINDSK